eukprot:gnl/TRDRNA2_/TRDRNA2_179525_c0_seq1.p1 gnl/TRDRNA2_/TRDRNA2_179525_c0~~gnl/TRDRNA2_/TRDRNA2_179525_c0_seq1.p1  ORF type:complete len:377 (+),score=112.56 gnl/TRDRNA2_/TRDRNA2_179525_c0_seq1:73-1203(+)
MMHAAWLPALLLASTLQMGAARRMRAASAHKSTESTRSSVNGWLQHLSLQKDEEVLSKAAKRVEDLSAQELTSLALTPEIGFSRAIEAAMANGTDAAATKVAKAEANATKSAKSTGHKHAAVSKEGAAMIQDSAHGMSAPAQPNPFVNSEDMGFRMFLDAIKEAPKEEVSKHTAEPIAREVEKHQVRIAGTWKPQANLQGSRGAPQEVKAPETLPKPAATELVERRVRIETPLQRELHERQMKIEAPITREVEEEQVKIAALNGELQHALANVNPDSKEGANHAALALVADKAQVAYEPPEKLPEQGLEGKGTRHEDGRTITRDWRAEYGPNGPDLEDGPGGKKKEKKKKQGDSKSDGARAAASAATIAMLALLQW